MWLAKIGPGYWDVMWIISEDTRMLGLSVEEYVCKTLYYNGFCGRFATTLTYMD